MKWFSRPDLLPEAIRLEDEKIRSSPEPYDAEQRRTAILLRARYLYQLAGRQPPGDLVERVRHV